jgi:hypothetical protein
VFCRAYLYGFNPVKLNLLAYRSIFIILFTYLFVLQLDAIWPFTLDDMYISLRYAKNWASGNGLLWNVNAPPVEGYSNFSFLALAALALKMNVNPVLVLKSAGIVGLFFTLYFLYLISRFWFSKTEALIPCLCLLCYKGQIIWAVSGLETTVYEALICASVYCCFRAMGYQLASQNRAQPQPRFFVLAGFLLALSGMTRPEAPALIFLFFILICLDRPKAQLSFYWQGVGLFCLTIILIFMPYFVWRFYYFGYLVPNSVYCKGFTQVFSWSLDGAYLRLIWPFALLAIPACMNALDKRHYFLWTPSLVYLLMLANSDPVAAFENRLFLPAFSLLLPLAIQGLKKLLAWYVPPSERIFLFFFYFFCVCLIFFFVPKMTLEDYRYFSENPVKGERLRQQVVHWLASHTKPGETVVLADSGLIPYYSRLHFIDSYCLNNLTMAHYSAKRRYEQFCQEILPQKPNLIILTSLMNESRVIYTPSDQCLKDLLAKQNDYKLVKSFISHDLNSSYRYEVFWCTICLNGLSFRY